MMHTMRQSPLPRPRISSATSCDLSTYLLVSLHVQQEPAQRATPEMAGLPLSRCSVHPCMSFQMAREAFGSQVSSGMVTRRVGRCFCIPYWSQLQTRVTV